MKTFSNLKWLCIAVWMISSSTTALAHEIEVHEGITANAAASAFTYSSAYRDFLNAVLRDINLETATNSLVTGSRKEDDVDKDNGGKRSYNHFYDPLRDPLKGRGLSDFPPDTRIPPMGQDSFTWASTRNCPGVDYLGYSGFLGRNIGTHNSWSWQNAREYEWHGLTDASPTGSTGRNSALQDMFRALGQVVHLLEDTTQPQHARNEQCAEAIKRSAGRYRS